MVEGTGRLDWSASAPTDPSGEGQSARLGSGRGTTTTVGEAPSSTVRISVSAATRRAFCIVQSPYTGAAIVIVTGSVSCTRGTPRQPKWPLASVAADNSNTATLPLAPATGRPV